MGLSLFLPVTECVSVALGVCVSEMGPDDVKTETEWLDEKYWQQRQALCDSKFVASLSLSACSHPEPKRLFRVSSGPLTG